MALIRGWLREKGTRAPLPGVTVVLSPAAGGSPVLCSSDERGYFEATLSAGEHRVIIQTNAHKTFKQRERLSED